MKALAFDTLSFAKKLKAVNFTQEQAEALAESVAEIVTENLATKADIAMLQRDLKEMEFRLTIRLGGMLAASVAIVAALVKLL